MPTKFISEISSNHFQSLERCEEFIEKSKEIGCDAVKFQLFKIDQLFAPEILSKNERFSKRKQWELPESFIPELSKICKKFDIEFSCTPFYLDAVEILRPYVDFFKIASYELLWKDLFTKCVNTGKPLIFSVGIANLDEIKEALSWAQQGRTKDITILHCSSAYPTPVKDANLRVLNNLREQLIPLVKNGVKLSFGWSDHTVSPAVILNSALKYNARYIEFHLDLDGKGEEYSAGHCWLPNEIKSVIDILKEAELSNGRFEKTPNSKEIHEKNWRADPDDGLRPLKSVRINYDGHYPGE